MILTIDIGNTNIVVGGFTDNDLDFVVRISTNTSSTEDEYAAKLLSLLALHNTDTKKINGAIISSVVPPLTQVMKKAISTAFGIDPITVAPGIKTGINIHCDAPSSVGADLICACVATHHTYGSPALIIDMGTATKMMIMDERGTFIGASIIPGVNIALRALSSETAQLPQISLEAPASVIGKNTADCMRSGVLFGNASMIDGMIDRFIDDFGSELSVYATGGLAETIIPHCKHAIAIDKELVLKGLNILYNKNK